MASRTGQRYARDAVAGKAQVSMLAVAYPHLVGKVIDGRYRLVEVIGSGGYSTVFRAQHERMPKQFAVKVLHRHHACDPEQVRRFAEEVRAIAVLEHPHIIEVVDYSEDPGAGWYIVMPLLAGEPLSSRLQRLQTLPAVDLHHVVMQAAAVLDAAHRAGVVHRDVKPENLYLQADPAADCGFSVRVLDFGIAKIRAGGDGMGDPALPVRVRSRVPSEVAGLGTPDFMSPEQVLGEEVDARTDVYALGVVIYEPAYPIAYYCVRTSPSPLRHRCALALSPLPHSREGNVAKRQGVSASRSRAAQVEAVAVLARPQ